MSYPNKPRLVYVAGAYRSKRGDNGVFQNILIARAVARELWQMGLAVICPHANTFLMDGPEIEPHSFITGDLVMVERCDGIVMLPGWEHSEGAKMEHAHATKHNISIFY